MCSVALCNPCNQPSSLTLLTRLLQPDAVLYRLSAREPGHGGSVSQGPSGFVKGDDDELIVLAAGDTAFRMLPLDLDEGAEIYADPAYTDYTLEDTLHEVADITLTVPRKKNSKRPHPGWITHLCERARNRHCSSSAPPRVRRV